jgi:hypothetical protein
MQSSPTRRFNGATRFQRGITTDNTDEHGAGFARNPIVNAKRRQVEEFGSGSTKGGRPCFAFTIASPVVCEGDAMVKAKGA